MRVGFDDDDRLARLDVFKKEVAEKVSAFPDSSKAGDVWCSNVRKNTCQKICQIKCQNLCQIGFGVVEHRL